VFRGAKDDIYPLMVHVYTLKDCLDGLIECIKSY